MAARPPDRGPWPLWPHGRRGRHATGVAGSCRARWRRGGRGSIRVGDRPNLAKAPRRHGARWRGQWGASPSPQALSPGQQREGLGKG
eukprot:1579373-Pyramimonas_sp.AAC.1